MANRDIYYQKYIATKHINFVNVIRISGNHLPRLNKSDIFNHNRPLKFSSAIPIIKASKSIDGYISHWLIE
jgi:hypothetical protein